MPHNRRYHITDDFTLLKVLINVRILLEPFALLLRIFFLFVLELTLTSGID